MLLTHYCAEENHKLRCDRVDLIAFSFSCTLIFSIVPSIVDRSLICDGFEKILSGDDLYHSILSPQNFGVCLRQKTFTSSTNSLPTLHIYTYISEY